MLFLPIGFLLEKVWALCGASLGTVVCLQLRESWASPEALTGLMLQMLWLCWGQLLEEQFWARACTGSCTKLWSQGRVVGMPVLNLYDPWHLIRVHHGALLVRDSFWPPLDPWMVMVSVPPSGCMLNSTKTQAIMQLEDIYMIYIYTHSHTFQKTECKRLL